MEHASACVNEPVPAERLEGPCIDFNIIGRESSEDRQLDATPEKQQWHGTYGTSIETSQSDSESNEEAAAAIAVNFLTLLQVTRPEVLRAVPAFQVLWRFGQVFRGTWGPEQLYSLSRQAESIDEFWSHSWQGSVYWKIWFFLMMKNGLAACLVGSLLACVMAFLSVMQYLPAWKSEPLRETKGFHGEYLFSPWALLSGNSAALLTLLLWRPQARVFVDRACIHQGDPDLKLEGVLNIAAIIKQSRALIVLWDRTYATRAWCSFELAAFLKSHQEGHGHLVIKPAIVAPFTVVSIVSWSCILGCETVLPTRGLFFVRFFYLPIVALNYYLVHKYWQEILQSEKQLKTFCWANTQCHCCSFNHLDTAGNQIMCDKVILSECIRKWFGSIEDFDTLVRSEVRKAFATEVMRVPFGYLWLVGAGSCGLWFQLDIAISRGRNVEYILTYLSTAPAWVLWLSPASLISAVWLQRRSLKGQILSFLVYIVILILIHVYNNVCWVAFSNELLGRGIFAVTTFPISLAVIFWFPRFRDA